jgi:hypothetical protein
MKAGALAFLSEATPGSSIYDFGSRRYSQKADLALAFRVQTKLSVLTRLPVCGGSLRSVNAVSAPGGPTRGHSA